MSYDGVSAGRGGLRVLSGEKSVLAVGLSAYAKATEGGLGGASAEVSLSTEA